MAGNSQGYVWDETFVADAALSAYRVVVAGEDGNVYEYGSKHIKLPAGADANAIIGVTQHATTASGDTVLVRRAGLTKLEVASSTVTYGAALRPWDAEGRANNQIGEWASGDGVIGYADCKSAASGDVIECWLAIRTLLGGDE